MRYRVFLMTRSFDYQFYQLSGGEKTNSSFQVHGEVLWLTFTEAGFLKCPLTTSNAHSLSLLYAAPPFMSIYEVYQTVLSTWVVRYFLCFFVVMVLTETARAEKPAGQVTQT